ncbi:MAG: hypothetical protein HKL85_11440 [Acidimicrobiaceae bacterium]|nr:hypothetical protein [Acidimicrobiaceae bacterium]
MTVAVLTKQSRRQTLAGSDGARAVATVSVTEAAKLCGVSDDTIRRRLHAEVLEGAFQDGPTDAAPWRIPVSSLVAVGLCEPEVLDELDLRLNPNVARLSNQLVDLRAELLAERTSREAAERAASAAMDEVGHLRKTVDSLLNIAGNASEGRTN